MKFYQYKIKNSYQLASYYYKQHIFTKDWSDPIEEGLIPEDNIVLVRREVELVCPPVEKLVQEISKIEPEVEKSIPKKRKSSFFVEETEENKEEKDAE